MMSGEVELRWPRPAGASVTGYHAVDGSAAGPAPSDFAVIPFRRQIQPMFKEPQESLSCAAKFFHFIENERNGLLHAPVGVLFNRSPAFTKLTGAVTTSSPRRAFSYCADNNAGAEDRAHFR